MINADLFGYTATSINLVMLAPQVLKTWKTKKTDELSLITSALFFLASVLWLMYGIANYAIPIIISNIVVGSMNFALIYLIIRYPGKKTTS